MKLLEVENLINQAKKLIYIFTCIACVTVVNGCATNTRKSTNYYVNFFTADLITEVQAKEFYDKKLLGSIVIWTDKDFFSSSNISPKDQFFHSGVEIRSNGTDKQPYFKMSYSNRFTIYLPPSEISLLKGYGSSTSSEAVKINLVGGETKVYYWKNPESKLIANHFQQSKWEGIDVNLSYLRYSDLFRIHSPQIELKQIVNKDESKVDFGILIKDKSLVKDFKLNGQSIPYTQNEEFLITKELSYGINKFVFQASNEKEFKDSASFEFNRLTVAQKKRIADEAIAEKKRKEEKEKQEKIRIANEENARKAERERIAREGDGSEDDLLCKKYGLKPLTNGYAECRMRLDLAKRESLAAQEKYAQEKAAYDKQVEAIQNERKRQQAMKQLELGLRMMGGQSPINAVNSLGTNTPIAPSMPSPINQTITMPNGRMVNCTTVGSMTNCF